MDQDNFDFKSENEWRYVPKKSQIDNYLISQNQRTYLRNKDRHNKILEKYPLKFKKEDIQVVFVSNQLEKDKIIEEFQINAKLIKIAKWNTK